LQPVDPFGAGLAHDQVFHIGGQKNPVELIAGVWAAASCPAGINLEERIDAFSGILLYVQNTAVNVVGVVTQATISSVIATTSAELIVVDVAPENVVGVIALNG